MDTAQPLRSSEPDPDVDAIDLSEAAAFGLRSLVMLLLFWLGWATRDQDEPWIDDSVEDGQRAQPDRSTVPTHGATPPASSLRSNPGTVPDQRTSASARRRLAFASTVSIAGAAAWIAGRRSGRHG